MASSAAAVSSAMRPANRSGSETVTEQNPSAPLNLPSGTLRLRAEPVQRRHIQWADDVVDNEGMGKKSSKVCCIYHKAREFGESSDESSSDSSSDSGSDSEPDNSTARPAGGRGRPHRHSHDHDGDGGHGSGGKKGKGKGRARKRSPNAYEKMPDYSKKGEAK
ncbi:hypothetical protein K490DRAFT_58072 [Saccharata proteae CBS 121410]|uniref:Type 1 phosphatases regulator n=1 Tax=Saccharata proteae CBS 121410 TaxID=1314787 RepID=A0A9P4HTD1_9PEZI|nr:hypothetical protein K490DRAFT_58072 [Saccharata proteae CBS 121410]